MPLPRAGANRQRAGEVGFPAAGGRDDEQVRRIRAPVVGGIASHADRGDAAAVAVVDLGDGRARDRERGLADELVHFVDAPRLEGVVDGGEEQLLRACDHSLDCWTEN